MIYKPSSTNSPRSNTYIGTIDNSAQGLAEYEAVKKEAREFNAAERERAKVEGTLPKLKKVDRFGRLGKNSPHSKKYSEMNEWSRYNTAYQRISISDAETIDVYVSTFQQVAY